MIRCVFCKKLITDLDEVEFNYSMHDECMANVEEKEDAKRDEREIEKLESE